MIIFCVAHKAFRFILPYTVDCFLPNILVLWSLSLCCFYQQTISLNLSSKPFSMFISIFCLLPCSGATLDTVFTRRSEEKSELQAILEIIKCSTKKIIIMFYLFKHSTISSSLDSVSKRHIPVWLIPLRFIENDLPEETPLTHWTKAMMILRTSSRITLVRSMESTWLLVVALEMASTAMSSNLECVEAVEDGKPVIKVPMMF